ncbi:hypothetical protein [Gynuella sp.]|uniref:hypothetical protein n=1 Tax=Gynuella sp. TaxID=2969146 RepID=UPI003D0F0B1D
MKLIPAFIVIAIFYGIMIAGTSQASVSGKMFSKELPLSEQTTKNNAPVMLASTSLNNDIIDADSFAKTNNNSGALANTPVSASTALSLLGLGLIGFVAISRRRS